jgi:hypothetical protein
MRPQAAIASALLFLVALAPLGLGAGETQPCASTFDTTPAFTDYCYHQGVWYSPDTAQFDVLILPQASPYALRDTQLAEQSVEMWDAGIHSLGASWLSGLNIDTYVVGHEPVPARALADPEVIVVISTEVNPFVLFGVAVQHPLNFCHGLGLSTGQKVLPSTAWTDLRGFHQHPGASYGSFAASCNGGGKMCYVVNTNFLWLPDDQDRHSMYDLISHEVGHCLTLGHVGDADTESTDDSIAYPDQDIMSYENDGLTSPTMHCVSNLNVRVIEKAFGSVLGQSGATTAIAPASAAYVHMKPADYSQPSCTQSTANYLDIRYAEESQPI